MKKIALVVATLVTLSPMAALAAQQDCKTGTLISIGNNPTKGENSWIITVQGADKSTQQYPSDTGNTINFDTAKGSAVFQLGLSAYLSGGTVVVSDNQGKNCNSFDQIMLQ